uniref:Probable 3-oxoacyl-[acyl-carrier-protein] reductase oxidoreductase (EC) n=1 Tax=Ganoderma boninense TaxID=34458 RepID=A0A5K1K789_9APHY|nr:Probable 3-oxoacyl-[acyl-carrier-protein] reductase oxidoreductase (EC [Ganoderma boninense]
MSLDLHSHRTQLVLTALGAAAVTAGAFSGYQQYVKHQKRRSLNHDVQRSLKASVKGKQKDLSHEDDHHPEIRLGGIDDSNGVPLAYDEELVREQLARNYAFFGDEGMARIRESTVVIVGCGGVGSWAAVMLARSGVKKLRLVDFDQVTLSSLNRHATAMLADVGTPKVKCIERTLKQISRVIDVDPRIELWRKESGGELFDGADWVIDAIDNITQK